MILLAGDVMGGTMALVKDLIRQFANMEFSSVLLFMLLMIAAVDICFEGYRLYKLALIVIGFAVGYTRSHALIMSFQLSDEQMLMAQVIAGIVCAILAGVVVHIGIFIAAYHFAQANLSAIVVGILLNHVEVPSFVEPVFTRLAGIAIAVLVAGLAVKAERPVVVILTAVVGGFAAVNFFFEMVPVFPVDISFFLNLPKVVEVGAKVVLSAAGVGIQGIKKSEAKSS